MVGRKRRRESWFRFQLRYQPNHPLCSDCTVQCTVILISFCIAIPNTTIPQYPNTVNTQYYNPTTPNVQPVSCTLQAPYKYHTSTVQQLSCSSKQHPVFLWPELPCLAFWLLQKTRFPQNYIYFFEIFRKTDFVWTGWHIWADGYCIVGFDKCRRRMMWVKPGFSPVCSDDEPNITQK